VQKKGLNVHFDLGRRHDYSVLVGAASSMITTSIAEGFGLAFLEPWTAGKALWGRRLGGICADFEENGLRLDSLYDNLVVPIDWFDADRFLKTWQMAVRRAARIFGHPVEQRDMNHHAAGLAGDGLMDFGLLDERCQRQVLTHLLSDPGSKKQLAALNPRILFPGPENEMPQVIEGNRNVVAAHYSEKHCREQLLSIYGHVIHHPVRQRLDKQVLLDAFFDLERFSLLKWGPYER
jgi:hypothetical protein